MPPIAVSSLNLKLLCGPSCSPAQPWSLVAVGKKRMSDESQVSIDGRDEIIVQFTVTSRKGEWKDAIDKYTRHPPLFDPPTTTTQSVGFFVRETIISSIGVLVYCMFPSIICGSQDAACRFVRRYDL
jgi:hypothetical protein